MCSVVSVKLQPAKVLRESGARQTDRRQYPAAVQEAQRIDLDDAVWGLLWYDNWTRVMRSLVMLLPIAAVSPIASTTPRAILKRYLVVRIDPQAQITLQQQLC
jgi:hypothetical protein